MFDDEFDALVDQIEEETGFACYETQPGSQVTFYGTSDLFESFKTIVNGHLPTGTLAFTMDDGESYIYSKFKGEWYNI